MSFFLGPNNKIIENKNIRKKTIQGRQLDSEIGICVYTAEYAESFLHIKGNNSKM